MTSIGIGDLQHAKRSQQAPKKASALKRAHEQIKIREQKKAEKKPSNEGQLSVDIYQTDTEMIITAPIAGVVKSELKVALQEDVLTIRGEREQLPELKGKTPLVSEVFWGTFSRSIVLPDHIDRKNIKARVHEHMLIISIPKTEDFKTRIIHINDDLE